MVKKINILLLSIIILLFIRHSAFTQSEIFDIPYSKQYRAYSCGQNSFRMVMAYWGKRLSKGKIFLMTGFRPSSIGTYEQIIKKKFKDFSSVEVKKILDSNHLLLKLIMSALCCLGLKHLSLNISNMAPLVGI